MKIGMLVVGVVVVVVMMDRLMERVLKSMMGTAHGSVPRRCFALKQIDEIYVQRHDRSYLTEVSLGPGRRANGLEAV